MLTRRKRIAAAVAVLMTATIVMSSCTSAKRTESSPHDTPKSARTSTGPKWVIPDLEGRRLDDAKDKIDAAYEGARLDLRDLSPRRRNVGGAEHWKVVGTIPDVGSSVDADEEVAVFLLRDREYDWFVRHPRMPRSGGAWDEYYSEDLGYGDDFLYLHPEFEAVRELVLIRFHRNDMQRRAKRVSSVPRFYSDLAKDPSLESAGEVAPRLGLLAPRDGGYLSATRVTWPRAGTRLRIGQLFIFYVRRD